MVVDSELDRIWKGAIHVCTMVFHGGGGADSMAMYKYLILKIILRMSCQNCHIKTVCYCICIHANRTTCSKTLSPNLNRRSKYRFFKI